VLCLGALAVLAPLATTALAEEPAWWELCEQLPSDEIEACFNQHNSEEGRGERPSTKPTAPIRARIKHRYPAAHHVFTNCPGNNRLGENGLACEFRFVLGAAPRVVKGHAAVEAEGQNWSHTAWWLTGFRSAQAVQRWRRCAMRHHRWESSWPVRLLTYATNCREGREIAERIGNLDVSQRNLRLPHRFTEGEFQTNTLGFVVSRFHCRGRVEVRQGNPNPYGHETAACRTRFGDKLVYVFDQGS